MDSYLLPIAAHFFLFLTNEMSRAGRSTRFVRVASTRLKEVSHPSALVPPKLLKQKITKPAIKTIEVYNMLIPGFMNGGNDDLLWFKIPF